MTALTAACVTFQLNPSMLSPALATIESELGADATGLGIVLSPNENPGAGLSFTVKTVVPPVGAAEAGGLGAYVGGLVDDCSSAASDPGSPTRCGA